MYRTFALPAPVEIDDDVAAHAVAHACDADNEEASRVGAIHALRGARDPFAASRALVPLLNEPRMWLGSEVLLCCDWRVAVGVDGRGRIVASPSHAATLMADDNGDVYCPDLGIRVVPVAHALRLLPTLPDRPPWAIVQPNGVVVLVVREPRKVPQVVITDGAMIGSYMGNDVVITRPSVHSRHTRVTMTNGAAVVVDWRNSGTTVNALKLTGEPQALSPGDVINVGDTDVVVEAIVDGALPAEAPVDAHAGAIERGAGAIERGAGGHVVRLGDNRAGVVRYEPAAAAVIVRGEAALGMRYHDDGALTVDGAIVVAAPADDDALFEDDDGEAPVGDVDAWNDADAAPAPAPAAPPTDPWADPDAPAVPAVPAVPADDVLEALDDDVPDDDDDDVGSTP